MTNNLLKITFTLVFISHAILTLKDVFLSSQQIEINHDLVCILLKYSVCRHS